ncbi:AAA family ATPase [Litorivicinus sp.]|nr:AAA family ATPase [Litorivicinus sp.]
MHLHTEKAILDYLIKRGLPVSLAPLIRRLFVNISEGHTALELSTQEFDLFEKSGLDLLHSEYSPLSMTSKFLQTNRHAEQEKRVAKALLSRLDQRGDIVVNPINLMPHADPSQLKAIYGASLLGFALILGGPGTGKTSAAAAILMAKIKQFDLSVHDLAVLAPTGKAAVRLTSSMKSAQELADETTQQMVIPDATTIHRQLNVLREKKLVLVDEGSMVSLELMDRLLTAMDPKAHLILMGDPNQLASVEAGTILSTLAKHKAFTDSRFTLTKRHRSGHMNGLSELQDLCLAGDSDGFIHALKETNSTWVAPPNDKSLVNLITKNYQPYLVKCLDSNYSQTPEFQCLSAMSHGIGGRHWVNRVVQDLANSLGLEGRGTRILVTENQPILDIYNGDIGVLLDPISSNQTLVSFAHRDQPLHLNQIANYEIAFSVSIHRAQGSEYQDVAVCLPEPTQNSAFIPSRELVYTAVTRAKRSLHLFSSESLLRRALAQQTKRTSCLDLFLKAL